MIHSGFKPVEKEPKASQMTIFYAGQVVVFNDFPPEKMEEIMSLARKGMSQSPNYHAYAHTRNQPSSMAIVRGILSFTFDLCYFVMAKANQFYINLLF